MLPIFVPRYDFEEDLSPEQSFQNSPRQDEWNKAAQRALRKVVGRNRLAKLIADRSVSTQYASEETSSTYTYPKEYKGPKPIVDQIKVIAKIFGLDSSQALEFAKNLPDLKSFVPESVLPWVGWFAIPSVDALANRFFPEVVDPAERYCRAILLTHEKLGVSRMFRNYREIDAKHLRMHVRTANALTIIQERQKGGILIMAAQLGMGHRGRSTRRAREVFVVNEFGLGSVMGCSIALTHPERFVRSTELDMDLPGDEFSPDGSAPVLGFSVDRLRFGAGACVGVSDYFGSASGFLSQ